MAGQYVSTYESMYKSMYVCHASLFSSVSPELYFKFNQTTYEY